MESDFVRNLLVQFTHHFTAVCVYKRVCFSGYFFQLQAILYPSKKKNRFITSFLFAVD